MTTRIIAAASAILFAASASAAAQDMDSMGQPQDPGFDTGGDFASLDVDGNGGLSLSEVQAAMPNASAGDFDEYDVDGSGELSQAEFGAWQAEAGQ